MRTINSTRNILAGVFSRFVVLVLSFAYKKVFIDCLGNDYLSINGLFTNILSILALSELGIGVAIGFSLYKPFAERDHEKIKSLAALYEKLYRVVGIVLLLLGTALMPFLRFMMKGDVHVSNLYLIYFLFLLQTVVSYLFFAGKEAVLTADQKNYLIMNIHTAYTVIMNLSLMGILLATQNYILVLLVQLFLIIARNGAIAAVAYRKYPYLRGNPKPLEKKEKHLIVKNIYALSMYKISGTVLNSTDSLVISVMIGTSYVGAYSIYLMITTAAASMLEILFGSFTASIGNLSVTASNRRKYQVFRTINFLNFWLYGFCAVCLWTLMNPFIFVFFGGGYVFDRMIAALIILNFLTSGLQHAVMSFKNASGLFWYGRYRPLVSAGVNLLLSIALAPVMGISGVILATIISRMAITFWFEPVLVHYRLFHKSPASYFYRYFRSFILIVFLSLAAGAVTQFIHAESIGGILLIFLICLFVYNGAVILLFHKSPEFQMLLRSVKNMLRALMKRPRPARR